MVRERLDQTLLRMGVVEEAHIRQALMRQKSHGGRLGSHLFSLKLVSERDLLRALEEHLGAEGVELSGRRIPRDVLRLVPAPLASEHRILPLAFARDTGTLSLAVVDPEDERGIRLARESARASHVKLYVAAEAVLLQSLRVHYHGRSWAEAEDEILGMSDPFPGEAPSSVEAGQRAPTGGEGGPDGRTVLMITRSLFLRRLLTPVFEREGYRLEVLCERQDVADCLRDDAYDHILVSEEMEGSFDRWIARGEIPYPNASISVFSSVSGTLLDGSAPYRRVAETLIRSLHETAASRCEGAPWSPPYGRICRDLETLAHALGLRGLTVAGLQVAALLLVPSERDAAEVSTPLTLGRGFLVDLDECLERVESLSFPWDVGGCLRGLHRAFDLDGPGPEEGEATPRLAVQAFSLVWFRHGALEGDGDPAALRRTIRDQTGHLAGPEVVDAYLGILNRRPRQAQLQRDIFVVHSAQETARELTALLKQERLRVVEVLDLTEARRLFDRKPPDAILSDCDDDPERVMGFLRHVRQDGGTLLFGLSRNAAPSRVLTLLDAGFEDVFVPPFHPHVLAARIRKALNARPSGNGTDTEAEGFTGTFRELPFVDLMQALDMSQRSVQIHIRRDTGEQATVYMRSGRLVHARCGERTGEEAIYRIIGWREEASFRIRPVEAYPAENISLPNDFVLMEGCRLLDEGAARGGP